MTSKKNCLIEITLDEQTLHHRSPEVAHERALAVFDLLEDNSFVLDGHKGGPYRLKLSLHDNRLRFDIRDRKGEKLRDFPLSLVPFRGVVKDYFTLCESYYDAIKTLRPSQIEAIDMGRRGVHNEGAALLRDRLAPRIKVDEQTARRLFALLCVLHVRDGLG